MSAPMTSPQPQPFVFGYFPRNKYKDLVFYVKTGEHSNCGLFEMPDTKENRELMDALASHSSAAGEAVLDELVQHLKDDLKFSDERGEQNMSDMTSASFQYYAARSATLEHVLDKIAELCQQREREQG